MDINVVVTDLTNSLEVERYDFTFSSFGIDDVRSLTLRAHLLPAEATYQLLVVRLEAITSEAQQALLKLIEEPPAATRFLFSLRPAIKLLPTVLSRVVILPGAAVTEGTTDFSDFAALSVTERLALITKKMASKDTSWLHRLQSGLVAYLRSAQSGSGTSQLALVASLLGTRGAGNKMLLEELAFDLPRATLKE